MAEPTADQYLQTPFFKVTLDGDPLKEESHFVEITGLDVTIDLTEYQEGGSLVPVKLPGPPRYSNLILRRGVTASKAFVNWVQKAANREVARMGGKIALCQRDGTPVMEWTFDKGWPCRYEGPKLNSAQGGVAFEAVEIAHEGLKMQG
ncbi:phage tail protein [Planctomycetota bacterium]